MLKDVAESQGWLQTLIDLRSDLKNPFKGFEGPREANGQGGTRGGEGGGVQAGSD